MEQINRVLGPADHGERSKAKFLKRFRRLDSFRRSLDRFRAVFAFCVFAMQKRAGHFRYAISIPPTGVSL